MIEALRVKENKSKLELIWSDGTNGNVTAIRLRENAMDAEAIRARYDGRTNPVPDNLAITEIKLVGNSAVNIQFSDGHIRAIYPYSYLKELSQPQ